MMSDSNNLLSKSIYTVTTNSECKRDKNSLQNIDNFMINPLASLASEFRASLKNNESLKSSGVFKCASTKKRKSLYKTARTSFETSRKIILPASSTGFYTPLNSTAYGSVSNFLSDKPVDTVKWFLWKFLYLKVQVLSKCHSYKKYAFLFLLFLPLVFFIYDSNNKNTIASRLLKNNKSFSSDYSITEVTANSNSLKSQEAKPMLNNIINKTMSPQVVNNFLNEKTINDSEQKNIFFHYFNEWYYTKIAQCKEELSRPLKFKSVISKRTNHMTTTKSNKNFHSSIEETEHCFVKSQKTKIISSDEVQQLVKKAILNYDADRAELIDYASESAGGSILSTRCSESYFEKSSKFNIFNFFSWTDQNSPRTIIHSGMQPKKYWTFKGSQGFIVIQLAFTIFPTGFTLEHIPISLSPFSSLDNAPKNFSVWGLISKNDNEGKCLGKYSYDLEGYPMQYFAVQNKYNEPFSFVELKIHSNHGNLKYSCLYRFRVHGKSIKLK